MAKTKSGTKLQLGIQLYSVREDLKKDFAGTIREVAKIGFDGVEFFGQFGGLEPAAVRALLDGLKLKCLTNYTSTAQAADPASDAYRYAAVLGQRFLTSGDADKVNEQAWPGVVALVPKAAQTAKAKGLTYLYHNHHQEFAPVGGKPAFDPLLAMPELHFEFDTAWLAKGGVDPVAFLRRFAGRIPLLHVKDITKDWQLTEIGRGSLDFAAIVQAARASGVQWLVYEQDVSQIGSLQSAKDSFAALKKLIG